MSCIKEIKNGVVIALRVVPRASKSEVCGLMGDALKVRLQAPPVDGKANKALIKFLSKELGVPQRSIEILSGETGRNKSVFVAGLVKGECAVKLGA